jgi:hypothetical protein
MSERPGVHKARQTMLPGEANNVVPLFSGRKIPSETERTKRMVRLDALHEVTVEPGTLTKNPAPTEFGPGKEYDFA